MLTYLPCGNLMRRGGLLMCVLLLLSFSLIRLLLPYILIPYSCRKRSCSYFLFLVFFFICFRIIFFFVLQTTIIELKDNLKNNGSFLFVTFSIIKWEGALNSIVFFFTFKRHIRLSDKSCNPPFSRFLNCI